MAVPEVEVEAGMTRCRADDRDRVREAWPPSEPRFVDRLAERKQLPRQRQHPSDLNRRRRRIARREFVAGGQANSLLHRRNDEALLGVEYRSVQARIADRAKVLVI